MFICEEELAVNGLLNIAEHKLRLVFPVDLRNGWQVISPSKSFTVYAATASEKTEWMAHIDKCAQDLLTKRKQLVSSLDIFDCVHQ